MTYEKILETYGLSGEGEWYTLGISEDGEETDLCLKDIISKEKMPDMYEKLSNVSYVGSYDEFLNGDCDKLEEVIKENSINMDEVESVVGALITNPENSQHVYLAGYEFIFEDYSKKPVFVMFDVTR